MFVKICGITTASAIEAAAKAGANAVGFVFARSPRQISPRNARALADDLPAGMLKVAVFRHPEAELVGDVIETLEPDWIQTDAEDFAGLTLPAGCEPLPVYRSGTVPPGPLPGRMLYEGPVSGVGRTADWDEARRLAAGTDLVLAGGLSPANVADAIFAVRPWGVDVSSGVERAPGQKDPARIAEFVTRAREAAARLAEREAIVDSSGRT
ncbi:MAG: phosphoribosylanthranilate isomerase [Gammaproteobacteria bacterium]|nr:phosphoribosylanthranilate isomerase [Gammaproteobacteria bacterium]